MTAVAPTAGTAKTGQSRALHVEQAFACANFADGPVIAVTPVVVESTPVLRECLFLL